MEGSRGENWTKLPDGTAPEPMGSGTSPREALLAERDLYNIEAEKVPLEGLSDDDGAEDEPIEMPDAEEGEQAA